MSLADKLRELEDECERDHPGAVELRRDISRMICDLELGLAEYRVEPDGLTVVRVPRGNAAEQKRHRD